MSLPPDYSIRRNGHDYEVWHAHFGLLVEVCETYGSAEDHAHEHAADRIAADLDVASDAEHDAIADLLHAVDRGDFGDAFMVGRGEDRIESAYLSGLRDACAARNRLAGFLPAEAA